MKIGDKNTRVTVAVVGAGAVGSYYGARLAEGGLDVKFLLRSDYTHVKEHGFKVESVAGSFHLKNVQCAQKSKDIGAVDIVIVAWKTTANKYYDEVIRPLLHENTVIITLQNGLGNVEQLAHLFGAERVFGGLCFVCINRLSKGVISHTASGLVRLGRYQCSDRDLLDDLVKILSDGGIHCEAVDNLEKAQWMKLVWNIPFNGLTISEGGIDTEALLNIKGMDKRIMEIMKEIQSVAQALGHKIEDSFLERQVVITKPMGKYRPSSMIDFIEGREVELNAIWEEPLRVAKACAIETPEIKHLIDQMRLRFSGSS